MMTMMMRMIMNNNNAAGFQVEELPFKSWTSKLGGGIK